MRGDHRSFARAAATSLLGFGLQLVLSVILVTYGIMGTDSAAHTAGLHVFISSGVWLMLAVVFDQHRRERIEAMEAETLDAASARESSVFGTTSDDLRVNAKRLAMMHKVLVPAVSIATGVLLIGLGVWKYLQFTANRSGSTAEQLNATVTGSMFDDYAGVPYRGWAISIGLGVAVVGFVFARYTSGMSKHPLWSAIRAGSSVAVAASLFGLAIALGQFAEVLGAVRAGRYLLVIFPIASIVLGAEVLVNFLLNLYRPRKAGEMPRPAVDSWLLGSIAAPDQIAKNIGGAIGYQFGVDVTGSWAYRLVGKSVGWLVLFAAGVVWLMTCVTVVGPDEKGVRVRLGEQVGGVVESGLHLTLPWPIERIERSKTTQLRTVDLATSRPPESLTHILWTNDHKISNEYKVIVRASRTGTPEAGENGEAGSTGDPLALLVVEVPLVYRVNDLSKWEQLATPQTRAGFLRAIARREVSRYLATLTVDELLASGRSGASEEVLKRVTEALARENTGVEAVFCSIEGVHPPKETAGAFESVVQNQVVAQAVIERATLEATRSMIGAAGSKSVADAIAEEIRALDRLRQDRADGAAVRAQESKIDAMVKAAGGTAGSSLSLARAERWSKHMSQRGAAESYAGRLSAFEANPTLYFATSYFETLMGAVKNSRLYLVDDSSGSLNATIDMKDLTSGGFMGFTQPKPDN